MSFKEIYDVAVIGAGPAGISASLYARRANFDVAVFHHGPGALDKASKIENYYGFPHGISGKELYENGIRQAENLGVEIINAEITHISMNADFSYTLSAGGQTFKSKTVIIAAGNKKLRPDIKGLVEFEGRGVSYCAICDAFAYRQKNVVVIGNGKFALNEADDIANVASSVKILTNGKDKSYIEEIAGGKYTVDERVISEIKGNEDGTKVGKIVFSDGEEMPVDGIFIALGEAGAVDFAKKLGIMLNGDSIIVNEKMETNLPGLYSCGNATGGLLQVSKAVYEGTVAGLSAVEFVRKK